jgi:DNA-binding response OmpR family regulator
MRVLVLGRHAPMLQSALTLLRQHGYTVAGFTKDEEILQAISTTPFDLVVIGGGVESDSRSHIKAAAQRLAQPPQVVDVYGPHHLLESVNAARDAAGGQR